MFSFSSRKTGSRSQKKAPPRNVLAALRTTKLTGIYFAGGSVFKYAIRSARSVSSLMPAKIIFVPGTNLLGSLQPLVESGFVPCEAGFLQSLGISKSFHRARFPADDATQMRADSVLIDLVAGLAFIENRLAVFRDRQPLRRPAKRRSSRPPEPTCASSVSFPFRPSDIV